jgi:hypothetical protein
VWEVWCFAGDVASQRHDRGAHPLLGGEDGCEISLRKVSRIYPGSPFGKDTCPSQKHFGSIQDDRLPKDICRVVIGKVGVVENVDIDTLGTLALKAEL